MTLSWLRLGIIWQWHRIVSIELCNLMQHELTNLFRAWIIRTDMAQCNNIATNWFLCNVSTLPELAIGSLRTIWCIMDWRLCFMHNWSQVLSREWRCSWSSADRRCSNYIWVINNFTAYQGASYFRGLTVYFVFFLQFRLLIHFHI